MGGDPVDLVDLTGRLPQLAVVWGVVEAGLTVADVAATGHSIYEYFTKSECEGRPSGADVLTNVGLTAGGIFLPLGGAAAAKKGVKFLPSPKVMADHHIFPQSLRPWFSSRGIDIDQYTVTLGHYLTHLRGVHGKGLGSRPGKWNKRWRDFKSANPNATAKEIFQKAGQMMDDFGLSDLPIHPYRK